MGENDDDLRVRVAVMAANLEAHRAASAEKHALHEKEIAQLKANNRWGAIMVIGFVLSEVLTRVMGVGVGQ